MSRSARGVSPAGRTRRQGMALHEWVFPTRTFKVMHAKGPRDSHHFPNADMIRDMPGEVGNARLVGQQAAVGR